MKMRRKTQTTIIRNEKVAITMDLINIKMLMKNYDKTFVYEIMITNLWFRLTNGLFKNVDINYVPDLE